MKRKWVAYSCCALQLAWSERQLRQDGIVEDEAHQDQIAVRARTCGERLGFSARDRDV